MFLPQKEAINKLRNFMPILMKFAPDVKNTLHLTTFNLKVIRMYWT